MPEPELLTAFATLAWPVIVLILVVVFARPLAALIRSARDRDDVTFEIGGQRISFGKLREQQNAITSDLQRQVAALQAQVARLGGNERAVESQMESVQPVPSSRVAVLWVDDQPANNALIMDQLRTAGTTVDLARDTAEGIQLALRNDYRVAISDLARLENDRLRGTAGVEFVRQLREAGRPLPTIIFASGRGVRVHRDEAVAAGADKVTDSASELAAFLREHGVPA